MNTSKNKTKKQLSIFDWLVYIVLICGWLFLCYCMNEPDVAGPLESMGGHWFNSGNVVEESYKSGADSGCDDSVAEYDFKIIKYENVEQFEEELENVFNTLEPKVGVIGITMNKDTFYELPYSTFWLSDYSSYDQMLIDPDNGEWVSGKTYSFTYEVSDLYELESKKSEVDREADSIISHIPAGANEWTKIKTVHDELIENVRYDHSISKEHIYDCYGALVNGEAVCNGYALAFDHVMRRLGIDSDRDYSDTHAWNRVSGLSVDNRLDITWDDLDYCDAYGNEYIDYSYFFLSPEEMECISSHQSIKEEYDAGYYEAPVYTSEEYNYYVHEGYLIYNYNWDDIAAKLRVQYEKGSNYLTVRFADSADYESAKQLMNGNDKEFNSLLKRIGYEGYYLYWFRDEPLTIGIGLNAKPLQ